MSEFSDHYDETAKLFASPGLSQYEVAEMLGVTRTRIHQIEKRAIRKIRLAIEKEAAAAGLTPYEWLTGD